jgi:tetratricopeptide (TPR) repeat protein
MRAMIQNSAVRVRTPPARTKFVLDQANAALGAGNAPEAERIMRDHLSAAPEDAGVMSGLAGYLAGRGQAGEALILYRRALAILPGSDPLRLAYARLLQQLGKPEAALGEVERMSAESRAVFDVRAMEAALLGVLGRHERELELYALLVKEAPGHPGLWKSYGDALKTVGRTGEAIEALRQAIKARPDYGEAWWTLSNFKSFVFSDRDLSKMRKLLKGGPGEADSLHLQFALGKAMEDRGQPEDAFRHYDAGNRIRAAHLTAAQMSIAPRVDAAVDVFTPELFAKFEGSGAKEDGPIFIVGLQRSGSTLIEQILASHPLIEGTSELLAMEQVWARIGSMGQGSGNPFLELPRLDRSELAGLGRAYLEESRGFRSEATPCFIDKLPANWLNVGLIRLILPNARIIDARRHPMACGFSTFKQHYSTGVTYSYSQQAVGRFYADYVRLMYHFDQLLPGAVHRVIHERLIDDLEGEVRRLLDHVGVPFDPACLEFHRNQRPVRTPSAEQVRRPINRDGLESWKEFEPWLGPLKAALGPTIEFWDRL